MALTKKMLAAMDIPVEKIDEIMSAHTETVINLKDQIETYKAGAEKAESLEKKIEQLEKETKNSEDIQKKSDEWEKKYNDIKSEYDTFKADTEKKEVKAKKENAFKELLVKAGISAKRIDTVMKCSGEKISEIAFEDDGTVKDADKIIEGVKTEWDDFISKIGTQGADVSNPPANNGGDNPKPSRAQELAAKYHDNLYGKGKEN